ncbi:MAG: RNA polymerase sigma factor [Candidatus Promineifilaceae bacterium]
MTEDAHLSAQQDEQAEAEWIGRAQNGDERAWEMLIGRHQTAAFRLAYLMVRDPADAEDVTQEAFVRAFLSLDRFERGRPFRPWLMAITANLARNRRRSLGRYLNNLRRLIEREPEPVQLHHYGEDLQARRQAQLLWQAVQQLNQKGQEVVYLRYFLEMSEAETAETLDIAPGTVKSRLHRALKQLRGVIERDFSELGDWR